MKNIVLVVISILLFSCAKQEKPDVKLHVFSGGSIVVNDLEIFAQDSVYKGKSKKFADAFYVIQHPKGNLVWDGGLPESLVGEPPKSIGAFTVWRKDSVVNQLKTIDLTVNDFKYIALSHTHFDHIGHANQFKNATWLVQEKEYDYFTNENTRKVQKEIYDMIKDLTKVQKLNGDYDVFGDGTVVIKSMPGHTIGHQVLYLDIGLEKPILLTGDLYHFDENRLHKRVPSFNYNKEETIASMEAFEKFAKEKDAMVIIQHSSDDYTKLKSMLLKKNSEPVNE